MHVSVLGVNFRVMFNGNFFMDGNVLKYKTGLVMLMNGVYPKSVNKSYLEEKIMRAGGFSDIKEMYYLVPGKTVNNGLVRIDSDEVIKGMMTYTGWKKTVLIYLVRESENRPNEIRNLSGNHSIPHSSDVPLEPSTETPVSSSFLKRTSDSIKNRPQKLPIRSTGRVLVKETEKSMGDDEDSVEDNSGDEILQSESSSDESEFNESFNEDCDVDLVGDSTEVNLPHFGGGLNGDEEDDEIDEMMDGRGEELDSLSEEEEEAVGKKDGKRKRKKHIKKFKLFNSETGFTPPVQLHEGLVFPSNAIFRKALRQFSLETKGDYYYLHNNNSRVYAYCKKRCICKLENWKAKCTCKQVMCKWKVLAKKYANDGSFQIKSMVPKHECQHSLFNSKINSTWLAERYIHHYKADPQWKLEAFREAVRREHDLEISYIQAWRARLRAMLMNEGDAAHHYAILQDYALTIVKTNPGSSAIVKVDIGDPQAPVFERIYVCMAACKMGFLKGCRDIIGVDGCHLRGAFTGQILVAVGHDGNNNIYPIAYAVVEAERLDTWQWFLNLLLNDVASAVPTFISDRQKGLQEALRPLTMVSEHRICVRHMYSNFKLKFGGGKAFKDLIWRAARACTRVEFNAAMDHIKSMDQKAYDYLLKEPVSTWSRHAFSTHVKSDLLLNNLCESFNSWILPAREKTALSAMEWIRRALMNRFIFSLNQFFSLLFC